MDLAGNYRLWNDVEHWETGKLGNGVPLADGEKWSQGWGNSRYQWFSSLLPRIDRHLPTGHVVEIACGRGRWSQYLKDLCSRLTLLDLSDTLVEYCRTRFADQPHVECRVTDGVSIPGVADGTADFVFSFDSLVHADISVMEGYLREIRRVLVPGGVAFLHHSNLGGCDLSRVRNRSLRDETVSAARLAELAAATGLAVRVQELVPWTAPDLEAGQFIDCFTTLAQEPQATPARTLRNPLFEDEKRIAKRLFDLYAPRSGS